jgi:hypothetical protein
MKTKLVQLVIYINNIDRRYIQFAYFTFMLALAFIRLSPDDGSGGTR